VFRVAGSISINGDITLEKKYGRTTKEIRPIPFIWTHYLKLLSMCIVGYAAYLLLNALYESYPPTLIYGILSQLSMLSNLNIFLRGAAGDPKASDQSLVHKNGPAAPEQDHPPGVGVGQAREGAVLPGQGAEGLGEPASLPDGPSDFRVERVETTLNRSALRAMQTPQGFALEAIRRAHSAFADRAASELNAAPDDAALAEAAGIPVVLVRGSERAMKITRPFDLRIAELLLADPALC